jgi:hypothetical protein
MFTLPEQVTSVTFPSATAKKNKKNTINRRYRDARDGLVVDLIEEIETFSGKHDINDINAALMM